ncbi:MAG TPA: bifunctional adenosylcobinamide kinase/adenosylcobinamide-phosphate guanylyltransferase [Polyangiales bacterium]|nr:bifunctional adenosylcobinamide kinase/adenosylcobinamide-phosphate guanylyltransferase [Polyangiales bacterium]
MPRLIVVGGGVRSGKSAFALARARELGSRRAFVATAQAFDGEMRARIERHVAERGDEFRTFEEPRALAPLLARLDAEVVVVDCLTLWLSNLLLAEPQPNLSELEGAIDALCAQLAERRQHVILVTNEVGMGVVPESALGRLFRDVSGRANQRVCAIADEIYFGALGCMLRLRPEPLGLVKG